MRNNNSPRILIVSQWPTVKNAEYELIEKIKKSNFMIRVVDILGFDVETNQCLNLATTHENFDFAIALHYETPKLINIPTYLWAANPPDFIHIQENYREVGLHDLRSFDSYLFNGSDKLANHIKSLVQLSDDKNLYFYPSASISALLEPPHAADNSRLFYCGVHWDRFLNNENHHSLFFEMLDHCDFIDFYGPKCIKDQLIWEGINSYKGEISFDGESLINTMKKYLAVLAISSPAHLKSETSSSRVFEGLAAGKPVISDNNPHVRKLFGDTVWYFDGKSDAEKISSLKKAFEDIQNNPKLVYEKVKKAQELMTSQYCFEPVFEKIFSHVKANEKKLKQSQHISVDLILLKLENSSNCFDNIEHILSTAIVATEQILCSVRIVIPSTLQHITQNIKNKLSEKVLFYVYDDTNESLGFGNTILNVSKYISADYSVFFTEHDFPQYDFISKALNWLIDNYEERKNQLYIAGFFENDLTDSAKTFSHTIMRNSSSTSLYRWSECSLAEHQLSSLFLSKEILHKLITHSLSTIDKITPIYIVLKAIESNIIIHRDRHITLRISINSFIKYYKNTLIAKYINPYYPDYHRELNALYEIFIEAPDVIKVLDKITNQKNTRDSLQSFYYRHSNVNDKKELLSCPDDVFVILTYRALLGREADLSGKKYYDMLLNTGKSRHKIIMDIARSQEGKKKNISITELKKINKPDQPSRILKKISSYLKYIFQN